MDQTAALPQLIAQATQLPADEQRQLAEILLRNLAARRDKLRPGRKWSEIRGAAPYPLCGEDAQRWVSRTREESDQGRQSHGSAEE